MLKVKRLTTRKELQVWGSFVEMNKGGFFQSLVYYNLSESLSDLNSVVICVFQDEIIIGSVLVTIYTSGKGLKKIFSRRALVIGGPIIDNRINGKEICCHLLKELNRFLKEKAIYIEFRNLDDLSELKSVFKENNYTYNPHLNIQVSLSNEASLMSKISSSKKRQINKSLKNGAKIIEANKIEQIQAFYNILYHLYKTKVKLPLPGINFFLRLFEFGKETGCVKYFLVEFDSKIVGGIICPIFNGTIYEWYIGSIDVSKNVFSGVLATWAPIHYGLKYGLTKFDFMGAGKPDEDYGVRDFKLKFGGKLVEHGRFIKINSKVLYFLGKMGIIFLKKIK